MSNSNKDLIIRAGGQMRPGDTLENYLTDLGTKIGLKVRSMWAIWRDEHMSAKSEAKLQELARQRANEKARNNDDKVAAKRELAADLEALANEDELAGRQEVVGILRAAAHTLRDEDHQTGTGEVNE